TACDFVGCLVCQLVLSLSVLVFFFQAEDGIRDATVTGVQTCALPICHLLAYPVKEIEEMTRATRKIGLGVMGFARMLFMLEVPRSEERRVGKECRSRWSAEHGRRNTIGKEGEYAQNTTAKAGLRDRRQ